MAPQALANCRAKTLTPPVPSNTTTEPDRTWAERTAFPEYLDRHPQVSIDIALSERVLDLAEEGYEAAIRVGRLPDSDRSPKLRSFVDFLAERFN